MPEESAPLTALGTASYIRRPDAYERQLWSWDEPVPPLGGLELRVFAAEGTWRFLGGTNTGLGVEAKVSVPPYGTTRPETRLRLEAR